MSVEKVYQKKSLLEQILLRPDTYVGSIEHNTQPMWVYDEATDSMVHKGITYVPGFYKIFDEILVNAADNFQRDKRMNKISVEINKKEKSIMVCNNGKGIPLVIHKEHQIYIPELIFGNLLTSSNYDDTQKKTTGGRNGYGAKLANIFSHKFEVECVDGQKGKMYKQTFTNNMREKSSPEIVDTTGESYTKITYWPDLKRFGMREFEEDTMALLCKRVHDMAGITNSMVRVYLNGNRINIKDFSHYIDFYLKNAPPNESPTGEILPPVKIYEVVNERWKVCVSLSNGQFQQVSFVNAISTNKGGTHVAQVVDPLVDAIIARIKKKEKKLELKNYHIKSNLWVFVNALIENPAFDSQTKENLTLKSSKFGSSCKLSDKFIKQVLDSGIIDNVLTLAKAKENAAMRRKMPKGGKKEKLVGMDKLEDANWAGGRHAEEATLILTEGDSAKSLAMAGIEIVGRDQYGVFPLRGKLLNVRDATNKVIVNSKEINNLMKIIGLKMGNVYDDVKGLRYGRLMIMADQDADGSHIKGLVINFIDHFWPSLTQLNGFMEEFITPIIKATKGQEQHVFYTLPEYESWVNATNPKGFKIKYYKGLGTSTSAEAKDYFTDLARHKIEFRYENEEDSEALKLAFSKNKVEARKEWLKTYNDELYLDQDIDILRYKDFVDKELILFSMTDNVRSIPSVLDGFKPGQRKILFSCFKRKLFSEMKVAQLSGYVAEHSAYHHGEASLAGTIVNMAQNFVGSNNINLLSPNGQFGTRHQGGKDHSSARYIFTNLTKVARAIFRVEDDNILENLVEEGQKIEPRFYLPIIPMLLVNGAEGIGTGYSTMIHNYNPRQLIQGIRNRLKGKRFVELDPSYKNYSGVVAKNMTAQGGYTVYGKFEVKSPREVEITELPIKKWTGKYKKFLEKYADPANEKDYEIEEIREYHKGNQISFVLTFLGNKLEQYLKSADGFNNKFNLSTTLSTTNMVAFNREGQLTKYDNVTHIMEEFFNIRLEYYELRKIHILKELNRDLDILSDKVRFIKMVIADELIIRKKGKKVLVNELFDLKFTPMSVHDKEIKKDPRIVQHEERFGEKKGNKKAAADNEYEEDEENEEDEEDQEGDIGYKAQPSEFNYLLNMSLWSLTKEKVKQLIKEMENKIQQIDILEGTSIEDLWESDLDHLITILDKVEKEEEAAENKERKRKGPAQVPKKKPRRKAGIKPKQMNDSSDSEFSGRGKKRKVPPSKRDLESEENTPPKKPGKPRKKKVDEWSEESDNSSVMVPPKQRKPRKQKAGASDTQSLISSEDGENKELNIPQRKKKVKEERKEEKKEEQSNLLKYLRRSGDKNVRMPEDNQDMLSMTLEQRLLQREQKGQLTGILTEAPVNDEIHTGSSLDWVEDAEHLFEQENKRRKVIKQEPKKKGKGRGIITSEEEYSEEKEEEDKGRIKIPPPKKREFRARKPVRQHYVIKDDDEESDEDEGGGKLDDDEEFEL